jgi:hypothetical protein
LDGVDISGEADANGAIATAAMRGEIVHDTGVIHIRFGQYVTAAGNEAEWWYREDQVTEGQIWQPLPVFADSILYNCTMIRRDALPADVVGVEITRLPPDGRVPIFRPTGLVYVHHTDSLTVTTPAAGGAVDCGRVNLERVWVKDANGAKVLGAQYSATGAELDAGVIHWADPLDNTGHPYPWTVYHRISAGGTARLVDTFGRVVLSRPLSRDFPADETYVSSALYIGDIQAAWSIPFFQKVWANTWADSLTGEESLAQYDYLNYPIEVTLRGVTYKTRVALIVTATASGATPPKFRCVLEDIGQIASNIPMDEDFSPINPATGVPIFTILADGWGDLSGWAVSNAVRFNLEPGNFPVEFARCLQPSEAAGGDSFEFEVHGNIDA